jgi:hypothetical protein
MPPASYSRDFVHWRFSDAGRRSAWIASSCRRPKTCTTPDIPEAAVVASPLACFPIYSFRVDYPQDIITISAFVITSFVVNFLVTRVRAEQRDHVRAQEELRESEAKIRRLVDSNIIGISFWA